MNAIPFLLGAFLLAQQVLLSSPVRLHYEPRQSALARRIAEHVAAAPPLPALPPHILDSAGVDVYLASDRAAWDSLTGGRVPEWGAGVAEPDAGVIVLPTFDWERTPPYTIYRTLRHELAHVALQRFLGPARVPRWVTEGYAQWAAGEWSADAAWRLRVAFLTRRAPPLDSLTLEWPVAEEDARIAYLLAASAIGYLVQESGERGLAIFLRRWRQDVDFNRAFRSTYGLTLGQFEEHWRAYVKRTYGWPLILTHSLVFWLFVALLLLLVGRRRRRRDRAKLARLRATEPPDDPAYWDSPG